MREDSTASGPRDLSRIWAQVRDSVSRLHGHLTQEQLSTNSLAVAGTATVRDSFDLIFTTEWHASAPPTDEATLTRLIVETTQLEHDIRAALDLPGARDTDAVRLALDVQSDAFSARIVEHRLPPLRVTVEQWGTIAGSGYASRCVVADRFDFVRAMGGRRSVGQVRRWSWGTDPEPYLPLLSERGPLPQEDVWERDPRIPEHMVDFDITGVRSDAGESAPKPRRLPRIVRGG